MPLDTSFYDSWWVQVCSTIREYRFVSGEEYEIDLRPTLAAGSAIPSAVS